MFIVFAAMVTGRLFVPPVVGVADNGDYHRVMGPLGLEPTVTTWPERYFDHVNLDYRAVPPTAGPFPTSQVWLGRIAVALTRLTGGGPTFRLTTLGAVNTVFYLAGILVVLHFLGGLGRARRITGWLLVLLVGTDTANIAFFNSFYGESATLIFLVTTIGLFLVISRRERIAAGHVALYFAAAALLLAAKPQNHPLVFPLLLLPAIWAVRRPRRETVTALAIGGLMLLVFTGWLYGSVRGTIKDLNRWNVLFYSVLADSPDPRADLVELGLDPGLARYAGKSAFVDGVPVAETTAQYDHGDIARFFLRHPGRFLSLASAGAAQLYRKVDPECGHYTAASGRPPRSQATALSLWQGFEESVLPRSPAWLVALGAGLAAAAITILVRCGAGTPCGAIAWLALLLVAMAAMQYGICLLGDGTYDLAKHLFLFHALHDTALVIALTWLAGPFGGLLKRLEAG